MDRFGVLRQLTREQRAAIEVEVEKFRVTPFHVVAKGPDGDAATVVVTGKAKAALVRKFRRNLQRDFVMAIRHEVPR